MFLIGKYLTKKKSFIKNKRYHRIVVKNLCVIVVVLIDMIFKHNEKWSINNNTYDLIIPIRLSDIQLFLRHLKFYKKFLNYSRLIIIGPANASCIIENDSSMSFIDEETILHKKKIKNFLWKMRQIITKRDLWYYQQFLKMAYSRICKKNYYLIWDVDTIPIKPIITFDNDHPFFDTRKERIIPYFNTLKRIFPGLKLSNRSYVTEHMMIKTDFMKDLLDSIEINHNIPGKLFWEKILMVIDAKDINFLGFSEFETYGSYVNTRYPNIYKYRKWYSKRDAKKYFGSSDNLNKDDINWLSKDYDALSFEKWTEFSKKNLKIIKNKELQKLYKPKDFFNYYNFILRKNKDIKENYYTI